MSPEMSPENLYPENFAEKRWCVYMVRCDDGSLYTGISTDVDRRLREHNGELGQGARSKGARYTRPRRPVVLVYREYADGRGPAAKREFALKSLSRPEKEALIASVASAEPAATKKRIGARIETP